MAAYPPAFYHPLNISLMNTPILAGKGVTAAVFHNSATKHRGQHNDLLFHEEHMIGAFDRWQMIKSAQLIMSKTSILAIFAGDENIILSDGKKLIRVKLVSTKTSPQIQCFAF